ncbi:MAG: prepilin-type N-terminal cleavage/methylation domain-containing protein [Roseburia sp.]|nr:prepilin-type N-terminal cleavage/methylation domain-containing protein [Roseburia sp.]
MSVRESLQDNSGFSLIEVMLAVAILALVTLPIINYYTYSSVQTIDGRERQTATMVAEDAAEELKAYANFDQISKLLSTSAPAPTATPFSAVGTYNVRVYYRYSYTKPSGVTVTQDDIKAGLSRVACVHVGNGSSAISTPSPTATPAASPTATPAIEDGPWEVDPAPLAKYVAVPSASPEPMSFKKRIKVNGFDYLAKVHVDFDAYDSDTQTVSGGAIDSKYNDYYIPKPNEVYADTNIVAAEDDEVEIAVSQIYTDIMSAGFTGGTVTKEVAVEETEIRKDKLKNIYMFYKPAWDAAHTEHFEITLGAGVSLNGVNCYLTYQNMAGATPPNNTYRLFMDRYDPSEGEMYVYSNLPASVPRGDFPVISPSPNKIYSYVKKEKTKRIGKIYVDVFDDNETTFNEDTAIAHVESTFAE